MAAKPIPEGYHSVSPALTIDGAGEAIDFYKRVFGAAERFRMASPDGKVAHAELEIGDSVVMVSDPFPHSTVKPPTALGGTSVGIFVYVEDVDTTFQQAVDAGASVTMPLEDMFWGVRFGTVNDPYGHSWSLATHIEDVPADEMDERAKAAMAAMSS